MRESEMPAGYYEEEGLGMAGNSYKHQNIIWRLCENIVKQFPELKGHIRSEMNVIDIEGTEGKRYPDISIWGTEDGDLDTEPEDLLMIIEITRTHDNDDYALGCIRETFDEHSELVEAFIYNYTDNIWYRYTNNDDNEIIEEKSDFSALLNVSLNNVLYGNVYYLLTNTFTKYPDYDNFDSSIRGILEDFKTKIEAEFPEYKHQFSADIKLENHLTIDDNYIPVLSFWDYAEPQGRNIYFENLLVLIDVFFDREEAYSIVKDTFDKCLSLQEYFVYDLIDECWIRYTRGFRKRINSEESAYSEELEINLNDCLKRRR